MSVAVLWGTAFRAAPASAAAGTAYRYAYATGGTDTPVGDCTAQDSGEQCSLTGALSQAHDGDTIYLASASGAYVGNWTLNRSVTIEPAPGLSQAVLDGNLGRGPQSGCSTSACDGSILAVPAGSVTLKDLTIRNAHNLQGGGPLKGRGGGVLNAGTLTVVDSTFSNDAASDGGAIDNGDSTFFPASLTVSGSKFSNDSASDGAAIDNGDSQPNEGNGTMTVSDSTFADNQASADGGAIDSADNEGLGTATVIDSMFTGNTAGTHGGAIDSADNGSGLLIVAGSTFADNAVGGSPAGHIDGGAIDTSDSGAGGTTTITASTFDGNSATAGVGGDAHGGAIDAGGGGGIGPTVTMTNSSLIGDSATTSGPGIASGPEIAKLSGSFAVAADVIDGACDQGPQGPYYFSRFTDGGYNVASDGTCFAGGPDDRVDSGLAFGALAYNGGSTQTITLATGNPAIALIPYDTSVTINGTALSLCPTTDQRHVNSNQGASCAAGAVQTPLLTITAPNATMTYGSPLPTLPGPTYSGFVLGQDASSLGRPPTCTVAGPVSDVGIYPIECSAAQNATTNSPPAPDTNYNFTYVAGTLTVLEAPQTITFAAPPPRPVVGGSFVVSATGGGSGLPVTFAIDAHTTNAACALGHDGRTVRFEHPGNCVIDAAQGGTKKYLPASASETLAVMAADRAYWADFDSGTIRVENPGGSVSTLYRGEKNPSGVAIDPAQAKIYWTDTGSGTIRVGNIDGSGRPQTLFRQESTPLAVAIDPAHGKIYWTDYNANRDNHNPGAIRMGSLRGGAASTLFGDQYKVTGLAIDPARGKIYWSDYTTTPTSSSGAVRVGSLNRSGAPAAVFSDAGGPAGLAVNPDQGTVYWSDLRSGAIRAGNLVGSRQAATPFANVNSAPFGVALDPASGQLYWTTYHTSAGAKSGAIRLGSLDPTGLGALGPASMLFSGEEGPTFMALLGVPAGAGIPAVSGARGVGQPLACSRGAWASDVPGANFYRAAQTFAYAWTLNGVTIPAATGTQFTPTVSGAYACAVAATNPTGSTTQTSASVSVR